jgi:hypothetical protein
VREGRRGRGEGGEGAARAVRRRVGRGHGLSAVFLTGILTIGLEVGNAGCATVMTTGSVYRGLGPGECEWHWGVRPAMDGLSGVAMTIQVTTDYPICERRKRYDNEK